jgi:hypothetical protein
MKKAAFEKTPEFKRFTSVMKRLIAVPKAELDEQVRLHNERSRNSPSRRGPKPKTARAK